MVSTRSTVQSCPTAPESNPKAFRVGLAIFGEVCYSRYRWYEGSNTGSKLSLS